MNDSQFGVLSAYGLDNSLCTASQRSTDDRCWHRGARGGAMEMISNVDTRTVGQKPSLLCVLLRQYVAKSRRLTAGSRPWEMHQTPGGVIRRRSHPVEVELATILCSIPAVAHGLSNDRFQIPSNISIWVYIVFSLLPRHSLTPDNTSLAEIRSSESAAACYVQYEQWFRFRAISRCPSRVHLRAPAPTGLYPYAC